MKPDKLASIAFVLRQTKVMQNQWKQLKRQNEGLIKRIGNIVTNQKHYLNRTTKYRRSYKQYFKKLKEMYQMKAQWKKRFNKLKMIRSESGGDQRYVLALTVNERNRLLSLLRRYR